MKHFYGVSDRIRRQADLFYADLMGEPLPQPRPRGPRGTVLPPSQWQLPAGWTQPLPAEAFDPEDENVAGIAEIEDVSIGETVPLGGRGSFRHDPLGGQAGDNVEVRWNVESSAKAGSRVDIVVYLHGYGYLGKGTERSFLAQKATESGLDMLDPSGAIRVRGSSPTLALVPRGRRVGGRSWFFDALADRAAFDALVDAGLAWLAATALRLPSGSTLARGRLTLMAHSGGGAGMSALLNGSNKIDPDEIVCFDSMYGGEKPIIEWAQAKIASAAAAKSGLRAFYTPCWAPSREHPSGRWVKQRGQKAYTLTDTGSWVYDKGWSLPNTEPHARRLGYAIEDALTKAGASPALANRFRVERTSVGHPDIPASYSPRLLDDIAANLPKTHTPPDRNTPPECVANTKDTWLTQALVKPGGYDPPPPQPSAADEAIDVEAERVYEARDRRAYAPSATATLFRTPPDPVAVATATEWPETAADADRVSQRALGTLGVTSTGVATFSGAGLTALHPIAGCFGEAALIELLRRLRYTVSQLTRPPHSFANDAAIARAFGKPVARPAILAIRTLLAIPGHFRQLARLAGNEDEAYALENLGWLLLQSLGDDVRTASKIDFWLPPSPRFVSLFADPSPGLSPQTLRLIVGRTLIDSTLNAGEYRRRFELWRTGAAGRSWRLETGRESVAGRSAGAPFYPEVVTIPPSINIASERAQVQAAWTRRVTAFDARRTSVPLTHCDNSYLTGLHLMARVSLRDLQLRSQFPSPVSAPAPSSLTGLAAVRPAFEAAFQAIADLGWNDLLVETQGMGCFRGRKVPGNTAAARHMSEHGLGIAVDLNVFENQQNTAGSMDPRIVALFESFGFRWGKSFTVPDPMHFEYAG
jgi:hypothetical protein